MIEVINLNISSRGLQILPIDSYYHLTSANTTYCPFPTDGGIKVIPELLVRDITDGMLYTSQVCKLHTLAIETNNERYAFDSKGKEYLDSESQSRWHYGFFPILENKIKDELRKKDIDASFEDTPFMGLKYLWNKLDYEIQFETWFQYKNESSSEDLIPLFSFNWYLKAAIQQNNGVWEMASSEFSDEQKIRESVKCYHADDSPNYPGHLSNLFQAVKEFKSEHEELMTKM